MYDDPGFKEAKFVPRLLLLLDNFSKERIEAVTIDAIHLWDDGKFKASGEYIGFESIPDNEAQSELKGLLGKEMSKAQKDKDRSALTRASELYNLVQ
jgi:hypothetical protein